MKNFLRKWRIISTITFVNYKKEFKMIPNNCFKRLFYLNRYWGNKIITIGIKHWAIVLDFRRDWVLDMIEGVDK